MQVEQLFQCLAIVCSVGSVGEYGQGSIIVKLSILAYVFLWTFHQRKATTQNHVRLLSFEKALDSEMKEKE